MKFEVSGRIDHHHHFPDSPGVAEILNQIQEMRKDMKTLSDQVTELVADNAELAQDVDLLITKMAAVPADNTKALTDALNAAGVADQDMANILAASDAVVKGSIAKAIAALNPDHPAADPNGSFTLDNTTQTPPQTGAGDLPAPVAVVTDEPTIVDPTIKTVDDEHTSVIVTDHPDGSGPLVTPVTSTGDVPAGSITVNPTTGVPTASADSGVTLGSTTPAADGTDTAAALAAADPDSVVSGDTSQD